MRVIEDVLRPHDEVTAVNAAVRAVDVRDARARPIDLMGEKGVKKAL